MNGDKKRKTKLPISLVPADISLSDGPFELSESEVPDPQTVSIFGTDPLSSQGNPEQINSSITSSNSPLDRRYDCEQYKTCLNLCASLDWDSFSCQNCSGRVNEALLWRARQAQRSDAVAQRICDLPSIAMLKPSNELQTEKAAALSIVEKDSDPTHENKPRAIGDKH